MKSLKVIFVIIVAVLSFSACTNVEEEIIGTWNFQTFNTSPQGTVTWTFKDNGELVRVLTYDGGISFDTCQYVIDKSVFKTQISISGSDPLWSPSGGQDDVNGLFRIDKFKDDILIMTRERLDDDETAGAYLRCEMIRKQ